MYSLSRFYYVSIKKLRVFPTRRHIIYSIHAITDIRCPNIRTRVLFPCPRGRWCSASGDRSCSCRCPRPRHRHRPSGTRIRRGAWSSRAGNPSAKSSAVLWAATRRGMTTRTRQSAGNRPRLPRLSISSASPSTWNLPSSKSSVPPPGHMQQDQAQQSLSPKPLSL